MLPSPTKSDKALWDRIRQFGCIVCRLYHSFVFTETEVHHILSGGQRISHKHVLGLCPRHHRQPGKGYESRHSDRGSSGKAAFENAYGNEAELLDIQGQLHEKWFEAVSI